MQGTHYFTTLLPRTAVPREPLPGELGPATPVHGRLAAVVRRTS